MQTDALEYTDRYDIADEVKQKVISALDWMGTCPGQHEKNTRVALALVGDIASPRILELGAGHGKLSAKILELHPTATVTISDLDPTSVGNIAAGDLGDDLVGVGRPAALDHCLGHLEVEVGELFFDLSERRVPGVDSHL